MFSREIFRVENESIKIIKFAATPSFFGGILLYIFGIFRGYTALKTFGGVLILVSIVFFLIGVLGFVRPEHSAGARTYSKKLKEIENKDIIPELQKHGLSREECSRVLSRFKDMPQEKRAINLICIPLTKALESLNSGKFDEASESFKKAHEELEKIVSYPNGGYKFFGLEDPDWKFNIRHRWPKVLDFSARACDALYLGDIEKMRELLNEAREMLDERDKFVIGDIKFFKYLFEFHYFLLKAVVEAYEAEMGVVAKATEEQAERLAKAKPVEVPAQVEKVSVSAEEPEKELYRGEVRFKMGAMSQERVGTLVITNKRLKLTGKYRLRGMVATVAVKAALRAAGVGEVYEDIPLKNIGWLELKKALLGGYYLEFKAKGKKYTIYTDAAQHIYNILKQSQ